MAEDTSAGPPECGIDRIARTRTPAWHPWRRGVAVVVVALAACGGGDDDAGGCGAVIRERLDPASGLHLLPGAPVPEYRSDPPTSGPHFAGDPPEGAQSEPLDRPAQVSALEVGLILVQYQADLDPGPVADLTALADEMLVVAPHDDLAEPVVLTAWLTKQSCASVSPNAVRAFVAAHGGSGPGPD